MTDSVQVGSGREDIHPAYSPAGDARDVVMKLVETVIKLERSFEREHSRLVVYKKQRDALLAEIKVTSGTELCEHVEKNPLTFSRDPSGPPEQTRPLPQHVLDYIDVLKKDAEYAELLQRLGL